VNQKHKISLCDTRRK